MPLAAENKCISIAAKGIPPRGRIYIHSVKGWYILYSKSVGTLLMSAHEVKSRCIYKWVVGCDYNMLCGNLSTACDNNIVLYAKSLCLLIYLQLFCQGFNKFKRMKLRLTFKSHCSFYFKGQGATSHHVSINPKGYCRAHFRFKSISLNEGIRKGRHILKVTVNLKLLYNLPIIFYCSFACMGILKCFLFPHIVYKLVIA